jgi:MFS family permease
VWLLSAATFIIFFQAYMVAPIIPTLSKTFATSVQTAGIIVPAYLIPYGIATLVYGLLADRLGLQRVMLASLAAFVALTALTATAKSIEQIALWRALTGLGASGVVPLALVLVGTLFPYEQRGRPLGWLLGAMLVPLIGWQGLFLVVAAAGACISLLFLSNRHVIAAAMAPVTGTLGDLFRGYQSLLGSPRGRRTYGYVLANSLFHSGVFTLSEIPKPTRIHRYCCSASSLRHAVFRPSPASFRCFALSWMRLQKRSTSSSTDPERSSFARNWSTSASIEQHHRRRNIKLTLLV